MGVEVAVRPGSLWGSQMILVGLVSSFGTLVYGGIGYDINVSEASWCSVVVSDAQCFG